MPSAAQVALEAAFADARLAAARALARHIRLAEDEGEAEFRRERLGILALAGSECGVAEVGGAELLSCRDAASLAQYADALGGRARWFDAAALAIVASWSGDELTTYAYWREARADALAEGSYGPAVAAAERMGHYALLFGDVATACSALDDALTLAQTHRLGNWWLRCAAASANLAFNVGDAARAAAHLELVRARAVPADLRALFAPVGVALATGGRNGSSDWTSPDLLETARSAEPTAAGAATMAFLLAGEVPASASTVGGALRRALLLADGAAGCIDLFALAARYGESDDARLGVDALRAMLAPQRPYLAAHFLLARANWCFRFGERADAIDSAGDAARAFDGMGLRRWTDDAMLLLVHQEGVAGDSHRRRRATAFSLTGREQQVAHLIRRGASNREVARTLQISEHTVERHVSSILSRLGLRSRWQIVDARNSGSDH